MYARQPHLAIRGLQSSCSNRGASTMTDTLPQIRVRADTQSRDVGTKAEAQARLPAKDLSNYSGNGRVNGPDSTESARPVSCCMLSLHLTSIISYTLLTKSLQHARFHQAKAIQADSSQRCPSTSQMPQARPLQRKHGETRRPSILCQMYIDNCRIPNKKFC